MADVETETEQVGTSFSLEEISCHNNNGDAWVIHAGKVYDVSNFVERHPGGKDILLSNSGQDVTRIMADDKIHRHSKIAYGWLHKYYIGKVREKEQKIDENDLDNVCMDGWREDMVDWSKPMLAQVGRLGPNYIKWVHSPVDRPLRLFYSDFVEFFSRTPWFLVPIIWIPVVIYGSIMSIKHLNQGFGSIHGNNMSFSILSSVFACVFISGCLLWSLVEYVLHRFLFHLLPPSDSPFWITFHFFLHGQHHKVPFDGSRLVFPPVAASVFAFGFYSLFRCLMPAGFAYGIFSGGLLGYVFYDCIHYYLHHGSPTPGGYFHNLKKYHVEHHFEDQQKGFGISSKLWDYPFLTLPEKAKSS